MRPRCQLGDRLGEGHAALLILLEHLQDAASGGHLDRRYAGPRLRPRAGAVCACCRGEDAPPLYHAPACEGIADTPARARDGEGAGWRRGAGQSLSQQGGGRGSPARSAARGCHAGANAKTGPTKLRRAVNPRQRDTPYPVTAGLALAAAAADKRPPPPPRVPRKPGPCSFAPFLLLLLVALPRTLRRDLRPARRPISHRLRTFAACAGSEAPYARTITYPRIAAHKRARAPLRVGPLGQLAVAAAAAWTGQPFTGLRM
eukprot:scaffold2090_cov225-Prasinococcus_capsulatus_cf.AAC.50